MTLQIIILAFMLALLAVALYLLNIRQEEISNTIKILSNPQYKELLKANERIKDLITEKIKMKREIKKLKLALEIKVMNNELEKED